MRKAIGIASLVVLLATLLGGSPAFAAPGDNNKPSFRVFVFHAGASGAIADAGAFAIRRIGKDLGFAVEAAEQWTRRWQRCISDSTPSTGPCSRPPT